MGSATQSICEFQAEVRCWYLSDLSVRSRQDWQHEAKQSGNALKTSGIKEMAQSEQECYLLLSDLVIF